MKTIIDFKTTSEYIEYLNKRDRKIVIISIIIGSIGLALFVTLLVITLVNKIDNVFMLLGIIFSFAIFVTSISFCLSKIYFSKALKKAFMKNTKNNHQDHI